MRSSPLLPVVSRDERQVWIRYWEEEFGVPPSAFEPYEILRPSDKYVSIVCAGHDPPARPPSASTGLILVRTHRRFPKPTTAAALAFGPLATRNTVDVSRADADAYLLRKPIFVTADKAQHCTGTGYVIVRYDEFILGVGLFRMDASGGGLIESEFPKAWAFG